ncbi:MAG TPA: dihydroorotase, partial [Candidatus Atribacteria bacterium]|nr:dihydroorotase [Candidatus Atribacteria bacterium]
MQKILIRNGELVNPEGKCGKYDILIEDGKVVNIEKDITPDEETKIIDASSKYI